MLEGLTLIDLHTQRYTHTHTNLCVHPHQAQYLRHQGTQLKYKTGNIFLLLYNHMYMASTEEIAYTVTDNNMNLKYISHSLWGFLK